MSSSNSAFSAAGSLLGAYGQETSGAFAKQMADYQASVLELKAGRTIAEAKVKVSRLADQQANTRASARARVGASGVTFEGSPTEVLYDQERIDLYDQKLLMYENQMEAWDLRTQAATTRAQGAMQEYSSQISATGSLLTAGSSLVGLFI